MTEFVIYSPNESAVGDGAGFWNQEDGWTCVDGATRFSSGEIKALVLPCSIGNDARWVDFSEARLHYGTVSNANQETGVDDVRI